MTVVSDVRGARGENVRLAFVRSVETAIRASTFQSVCGGSKISLHFHFVLAQSCRDVNRRGCLTRGSRAICLEGSLARHAEFRLPRPRRRSSVDVQGELAEAVCVVQRLLVTLTSIIARPANRVYVLYVVAIGMCRLVNQYVDLLRTGAVKKEGCDVYTAVAGHWIECGSISSVTGRSV